MTIADEIEHLHVLYEQGVLTHAEFTQAKSAVLGRSAAGSPQPDDHTKAIHLEHELARLDREWMLERASYMVTSRYGARSIPSQGGSIVVGVLIGAFGLVWTISAASLGAPSMFPVFGVLFILVGIGNSVHSFMKAGAYQHAEQAYQQRRAEVLAQYASARNREPHSRS